jgi:hypothetical protein
MEIPHIVPKEIAITCGIFLFAFFMGANLLHSLGNPQDQITAAVTVDLDEGEQAVATVKKGRTGIFGFFSDEEPSERKASDNLITGHVTGVPKSGEEEIVQMGSYSVSPSFVIDNPSSGGTFDEKYEEIHEEIEAFSAAVDVCVQERNGDERVLDSCIQMTLSEQQFSHWLAEEKCESADEQVFYDFVQRFEACVESTESSCACTVEMPYERGYGAGTHIIKIHNTNEGIHLSLDAQDPLSEVLNDRAFRLLDESEESIGEVLYSIEYAKQDVKKVYFGLKGDDSLNSLSPGEKSLATSDGKIFINKQGSGTTFVSEELFSSIEQSKASCTIIEKPIHKFCAQKEGSPFSIFAIDFS